MKNDTVFGTARFSDDITNMYHVIYIGSMVTFKTI
jgi:hypothetical protein